jgi:hypothetical protein
MKSLKRIKKYKDMLLTLANSSPKMQRAILQNADSEIIKAVLEIVLNVMKGNVH